jgi:peptidoglycan/LPS O-acetylase OafA/YrhL
VFAANSYPNVVNGSLWTVPFELECYLALVILAAIRLVRPGALVAMIIMGGFALITLSALKQVPDLKIDSAVPGRALILCFLAGVLIYSARNLIPYSGKMAVAGLVIGLAFLSVPTLYVFCAIPVAYATVWLGLQNVPKLPLVFTGDYSYGIYLYAFPIQQAVATTHTGYLGALAIALAATACCAAFSWHVIERPALRLRKLFQGGLWGKIKDRLSKTFRPPTEEEYDARQW